MFKFSRGKDLVWPQENIDSLVSWWYRHSVDRYNGGFYGKIFREYSVGQSADKTLQFNAKILNFFSLCAADESVSGCSRDKSKLLALRAYHYLSQIFEDRNFGGAFLKVDCSGKVLDARKHLYAQALVVCSLTAYYKLTKKESVLEKAMSYFHLIEQHGRDNTHGGYYEFLSQDWNRNGADAILEAALPSSRALNTHLHIIDAYAKLYDISGSIDVREAIEKSADYIAEKIEDFEKNHLELYIGEASKEDSYPGSFQRGKDIRGIFEDALKALENKVSRKDISSLDEHDVAEYAV